MSGTTQQGQITVQSPPLFGRRVIYTDYKEVNEGNLLEVLNDALLVHAANRHEADYLRRYYRGDQPSLYREKATRKEIVNRIVENRANEIVAFKTGYLIGEPLQYVARGKSDKLSNDVMRLNDYMVVDGKDSKDKELAEWFYIAGTGYRMILPVEEGEDKELTPFHTYVLDPRLAFDVYYSGLGHKRVLGVMIVENKYLSETIYAYTDKEYFEVKNGEIIDHKPHMLGAVPIIEYPANNARLGAFEIVVPLLDSLNTLDSNRMDGIEQFVQAIMVFINTKITEENLQQLYPLGALEINSENGLQADVKYLVQELNQSQTQVTKDDIYNSILTIVGMPNRNGGSSTSDTGRAVIMRDGWSDAEARAKGDEAMFKQSEREFLDIALRIASDLNGLQLKTSDIDIRFTRRNYENITEKANVLTTMLANNKIHPQLAFTHCGMFADPELAYKMSEEWQEKNRELAMEQANLTNGGEDVESTDQPGADGDHRDDPKTGESGGA